MAVTPQALLDRVGGDSDQAKLAERCLAEAGQYLDQHIGEVEVPEPIRDLATLVCAEQLFTWEQSSNGVMVTVAGDGGDGSSTPIRLSYDPMAQARRVLAPWVPIAFVL